MNIKSLLLGSAAALLAVSGARAADAVTVAEPEPAEYVKICDVYGAGYFYIPGTETCLKIGGYVRFETSAGDTGSFDGRWASDVKDGGINRAWSTHTRFDLQTDTGTETELGTLKTHTETRFEYTNGATSADTHFAWISLGGLRMGVDESAFDTWVGYAGNVINDTLVPYGGFGTNFIQYTFDAGNGFSAMVAVEQGSDQMTGDVTGPSAVFGATTHGYTLEDGAVDSYVPNVLAGAKFVQGWGDIIGVVAYDSNWGEWAAKVRADVNVNSQLTLWAMFGYGNDDGHTTTAAFDTPRNFYKLWGGDWAVWGGGTYKFNEKTAFNAQLSYDESKSFGLAANVAYTIVPGFTVTTELNYVHQGDYDPTKAYWTGMDSDNALGGIIRFDRTF